MKRSALLLWHLLLPLLLAGQIRVIPQQRLDSVQNPQLHASRLHFPTQPLEMGLIEECGGVWRQRIVWQNNEKQAVAVTAVTSSCGCLRGEFTQEPVPAGATGELTLIYNPKGHPGAVNQRLYVYTTLSALKPVEIIRLTGQVIPDADRRGDYPVAFGPLLLRQAEVLYEGGAEVRIACMNGGSRPLRITHDSHFTPQGITIQTEPEQLEPRSEGDLLIRLDNRFGAASGDEVRLLLEGLDLPPLKRTLRLRVK